MLTLFALGARVRLQPWERHGNAEGEIVTIGRKWLTVKLDAGPLLRRLHPSSLIMPLPRHP